MQMPFPPIRSLALFPDKETTQDQDPTKKIQPNIVCGNFFEGRKRVVPSFISSHLCEPGSGKIRLPASQLDNSATVFLPEFWNKLCSSTSWFLLMLMLKSKSIDSDSDSFHPSRSLLSPSMLHENENENGKETADAGLMKR